MLAQAGAERERKQGKMCSMTDGAHCSLRWGGGRGGCTKLRTSERRPAESTGITGRGNGEEKGLLLLKMLS